MPSKLTLLIWSLFSLSGRDIEEDKDVLTSKIFMKQI